MSHLHLEKKRISRLKALGWSLLLCGIFGGSGTLIAYEPNFQETPMLGLVTVWTLSIAIGVAGFWNARRPSWVAVFIVMFSITTLFLGAAIHTLAPYLFGWIWIVLLTGAYSLAWALPLFDPHLAKRLNDEQLRPQSWLGRNMTLLIYFLAVLGAVVIGLLGRQQTEAYKPSMLFIGTMSAILAIGGGQTFAYQVRERREKEIQPRKALE